MYIFFTLSYFRPTTRKICGFVLQLENFQPLYICRMAERRRCDALSILYNTDRPAQLGVFQEEAMAIKIAKKEVLPVVGRLGAMCSSCPMCGPLCP
jgi:Mb-OB3b family methanobactin precursor